MKPLILVVWLVFLFCGAAADATTPTSEDTETCISCHARVTPGIVADWENSRHSNVRPAEALKKDNIERRISAVKVPETISGTVVGCAECHTLNPEKHTDTFDHNGYQVHVVVTPHDCTICHPSEVNQYAENMMSHAHINLNKNSLYNLLAETINGIYSFNDNRVIIKTPDELTIAESCLHCHGTAVEVKRLQSRKTTMGEMEFPVLSGWPNQGPGRLNPDGSMGSCTSCHARHRFSIEMARKPYTCSQCHKGPDVPAYGVYQVSKHGNIFSTLGKNWDFSAVPWVAGKDFTAPTCATCHASLITNSQGEVVAERTHQMNNRSPWRIFGLIYAHAHPKSPDTTFIKNKAGLPLPTELTGEPAAEYLINPAEQEKRRNAMRVICLSCHSQGWADEHFARLENTVKTTNEMTLTATRILLTAWNKGAARGPAQNDSIFNEAIEKKWVEQWLFFANSTRFASAMSGADYGAFANGRWYMSKNIEEMLDWLKFKRNQETRRYRKKH